MSAFAAIEGFIWALRREGIAISTAEAMMATQAARLVGFEKERLRDALRGTLVHRASDLNVFDGTFERYFSGSSTKPDLWQRLRSLGVTAKEIELVRQLFAEHLPQMSELLERGVEFDWHLTTAKAQHLLGDVRGPSHVGVYSHRLMDALGFSGEASFLQFLAQPLTESFGDSRARAILRALLDEARLTQEELRKRMRDAAERNEARPLSRSQNGGALTKALTELTDDDIDAVRRALREFIHRLDGGERSRAKTKGAKAIDIRRTMQMARRTLGVPIRLAKRSRKQDKPRLVFLCDVSDSVRNVSLFLLELSYLAREIAERTRTFVFVSQVAETTELFRRKTSRQALSDVHHGNVVPISHNSNYGRAFDAFLEGFDTVLDRHTTLVILGDGRTNYAADGLSTLAEMKRRASRVVFLCPEPRSRWGLGDSAMPRYEQIVDAVQVRDARELFAACRDLFR